MTALITGATEGIGYELSRRFAQDGYNLVVSARSEQDLKHVAAELEEEFGVSATVVAADLSRPEAPERIFSSFERQSIRIDALVNNAGFGRRGLFAETDIDTELAMMQVNMVAPTYLTKLFLPDMLEQGEGRILNVASTASFLPGPLMAVYYASKAYLLSFSQAVASELEGSGVTVTALCPGPTETGFHDRADQRSTWLLHLLGTMDPEMVARAGFRGMMKGRRIAVPSFQDRLIVFFQRLAPRAVLTDVVRELLKRRKS